MEDGVLPTPAARKTMGVGGQTILEARKMVEAGAQSTLILTNLTLRMPAVSRVGINRPLQVLGVGGAWKKSPAMHRKIKERGR